MTFFKGRPLNVNNQKRLITFFNLDILYLSISFLYKLYNNEKISIVRSSRIRNGCG